MKKKKLVVATLTASVLFCAGFVFAEEGETVFQLDQVTVTADRIPQPIKETPANVTVITAEELQNKGARTLAEALVGVSGLSLETQGGVGEFSRAFVMGSDRVVVLIDGKRMNVPQGVDRGYGGVNFSSIMIADDIDRIEIVRGGASSLYGADAVGGVINIITKKGTDSTWINTAIAGGNHGGRSYKISAGGRENNTSWRLSGQQEKSDVYRANTTYKGNDVSFRLDHDLNKKESLTFTYDYYNSRTGMPGYFERPGYPPTPDDFSDILRHNWSIDYTKKHTDGSRIFRYYENKQTNSGFYEYGTPTPYPNHKNSAITFEYQDTAKLDEKNILTWGGEWRKEKVDSTNYNGGLSYDRNNKALFLQNQIAFDSVSKLTLGIRYDDNSVYGKQWSPKAAYLYQKSKNTSYFANWGKVFKAPTFNDLYWYEYFPPSPPWSDWGAYGDPNLKPETGWTAETGVKTKINKANEATVSVFKRNLNDAIRWDFDKNWHYQVYNIDSYKSTGLTANLVSVISPAVTTNIGYTYLDSCDQNGDSTGDPRHTSHIGINIKSGKWNQGVYGIYRDKTGRTSSDSQVGEKFVVNTNINYSLTKETSLFLKINNLFNREYQDVKYYPASKRTFLLGVRHSM